MPDQKKYFLTSVVIPTQVFKILFVNNDQEWTTYQVREKFEQEHRIKLSADRTRQILNDFAASGMLSKEVRINSHQQKTGYYKFQKL